MTIPVPTECSTLTIAGVSLRVYVLDDGQRVIDATDLESLLAALATGKHVTDEEVEEVGKAMQGCYPTPAFLKHGRAD